MLYPLESFDNVILENINSKIITEISSWYFFYIFCVHSGKLELVSCRPSLSQGVQQGIFTAHSSVFTLSKAHGYSANLEWLFEENLVIRRRSAKKWVIAFHQIIRFDCFKNLKRQSQWVFCFIFPQLTQYWVAWIDPWIHVINFMSTYAEIGQNPLPKEFIQWNTWYKMEKKVYQLIKNNQYNLQIDN